MNNIMWNKAGGIGMCGALGVLLSGCASRVEVRGPAPVVEVAPQPAPVYVAPAPVYVAPAPQPAPVMVAAPGPIVITAETDFYQPLASYGRWEDIPGAGHCWIPEHVSADWRPYTVGHWERTDAGWYWASDEPFGWATCHYGRWDSRPDGTWYWVAGVHWAPAWVSWRNGGGYAGWAPLPPAAKFEAGVGIHYDVNLIPARSYCFVPEQHFTEPIRTSTVIVNNTTIINKTVNITNVRVVNNTIINEGPPAQRIEKAMGHPVQITKVAEVRKQSEERVAIKPKPVAAGQPRPGERLQTQPARDPRATEKPAVVTSEGRPVEKPPIATRDGRPVEKPAVVTKDGRPVEKPVVGTRDGRPVEKPAVVTKEVHPVEKPVPGARPETVAKPKPVPAEHATEKPPVTRPVPPVEANAKHPPTEKQPAPKPDKKPPVKKPVPPKKDDPHPEPEKPAEPKKPDQP